MKKYIFIVAAVLWYFVLMRMTAFAVSSNDIIVMKKAGVSDDVIKEIINSDAISRALITVDDVIKIKEARVGDEVILAIIHQGNVSGKELDHEEFKDRTLKRQINRLELRLDIQKKEIEILREHLSKLITNSDLIRLVNEGKIDSENFAEIVKYLKHYARDEDTVDYPYDSDINIDINKIQK